MKNRIRELRQSKDLTQAELAEKLGVSQGAIQKLENGIVDLDLKWMSSISKALGTQPYELLPQEWQPPKMSEQDLQLLQAVKSLASPKTETNTSSDPDKQAQIPAGKEQER